MEQWQNIFEQHPEPMIILDIQTWQIQEVNYAFSHWTGYSCDDLRQNRIECLNILYKKDLKNIATRLQHSLERQYVELRLRILALDNVVKEARVLAQNLTKTSALLIFQDLQSQKESDLDISKSYDPDTMKRLFSTQKLLDRFLSLPAFCQFLQHSDPKELEKNSILWLCKCEGMGYFKSAIFWITQDKEYLQLAYAHGEYPLHKIHLNKQHKYATVARGEKNFICEQNGEFVVPIYRQQSIIGILQVCLAETERTCLNEDSSLYQVHETILQDIAGWIGLLRQQYQQTEQISYAQTHDVYRHVSHFQGITQIIQEWQKHDKVFHLVLWSIDNFFTFEKWPENQVQTLIQEYIQQLSFENVVASISPQEFAVLYAQPSLSEMLFTVQNWKMLFATKFPDFSISLGLATYFGNVTLEKFWKQARTAFLKSQEYGGKKFFYYNHITSDLQEIIERSNTVLS